VIVVPAAFRTSAIDTFGPDASAWCDRLPAVVAEFAERWALAVDLPSGREPWYGRCGVVVPVRTGPGEAAVLKVSWADEETAHEHTALEIWNGDGAARLLAADGPRRVLLMERLDPARTLASVPIDDAVQELARLLDRLAVPAPNAIETVADRAARWVAELPDRWRAARPAHPRWLLDHAIGIARELGPASGDALIHTDLHYENVLAPLGPVGERGGWLAIDPKPMAGDREFGVLPTLWNRLAELDGSDVKAALRRRLELFVDAARLDLERARAWTVARAVETVVWNAEIGLVQEEQRPAWIAETLATR
jgi:streptomycin 6-kinase